MPNTTKLTSPVLTLAVSIWLVGGSPSLAVAGLLFPGYPSLGTLTPQTGAYQVNTSTGIMTLPGGQTITGLISNGVAIFTFSSIDLENASFTVTGSLPFALLSKGDFTMYNSTLDVSANGPNPGAGGDLSPIGQGQGSDSYPHAAAGGGGGFGGAGGQGGPFVWTGIPEIPHGPDYVPGGAGGSVYGGLSSSLQGGSAGAGAPNESSGGGGGGAVELGTYGTLSLVGDVISANGGDATGNSAGGGSGGSISLAGAAIDLSSELSVVGGNGSPDTGSGGPGGYDVGPGGGGGGSRRSASQRASWARGEGGRGSEPDLGPPGDPDKRSSRPGRGHVLSPDRWAGAAYHRATPAGRSASELAIPRSARPGHEL